MADKIYVVHPGKVKSQYDGDIHKIGFAKLAKLYGLNPNDRNVVRYREYQRYDDDTVHLYPQKDGNYSLNEVEE